MSVDSRSKTCWKNGGRGPKSVPVAAAAAKMKLIKFLGSISTAATRGYEVVVVLPGAWMGLEDKSWSIVARWIP